MSKITEYPHGTLILDPIGGDVWSVTESVYDHDDQECYAEYRGNLTTDIIDPDGDRDYEVAKMAYDHYAPEHCMDVVVDGIGYTAAAIISPE